MKLEAVMSMLANLGFRKRAGDVLTIDLAPSVLGWLGLNRATRHHAPSGVEINPVVGVRFQEVERLVADCRGEKFHTYQPPTISRPLGHLTPEKKYKAWLFEPAGSEESAEAMVNMIATCGIPFMRSVVDIAELRRQLEDGAGFEHQLAYRRPVAALLARDAPRASVLLEEEVAAIGARTDLAAADFAKFAKALRARILSQSISREGI